MQTGLPAHRLPAVGDIFTHLTVIALPSSGTQKLSCDRWLCRCECTTIVEVLGSYLIYKNTKSCGCLRDLGREQLYAHHRLRHSARVSWKSFLKRQGADVHPVWRDSFEDFFTALGPRPDGHVLSRHDFEGAYDPENCFREPRRAQVERVRARRWETPNSTGWEKGPRKTCTQCRVEKDVGDFYTNVSAKTQLHTACKVCLYEKRRHLYGLNVPKRILANAKNRALERGMEFSITPEDLVIPTHCPVFGMKLTFGSSDDKKTKAGLGRTDDIKKGTYQLLKFGAYYRAGCPRLDIRGVLAANLDPLFMYADYLEKLIDARWAPKSKFHPVGPNSDELRVLESDLFYIYDCLLAFNRPVINDPLFSDAFNFPAMETALMRGDFEPLFDEWSSER